MNGQLLSRPAHRPCPQAAALVAVAAATLVVAGLGVPGIDRGEATSSRVIVLARPGSYQAAGARVRALGGHLTRPLPLVGGFAATLPGGSLPDLRSDPAVSSVTADSAVHVASSGAGVRSMVTADPQGEPTSVYPRALRADRVWAAGDKGAGVTVALVDTGVTAGTDLAGRVLTV